VILGAIFAFIFRGVAKIFRDFAKILTYFMGFCPNFYQIITFGGELAPPPPTPLLSCTHSHRDVEFPLVVDVTSIINIHSPGKLVERVYASD